MGSLSFTAGDDPSLLDSPWARACVWLLLATGVIARLSPLLDINGRLYWQFLTEDGYLMQTIARNMAIGLGMTTANGTIPTNGVQPLVTFLYAGLHWLAGGSKLLAIGYVTVFSALVAVAAAWFLRRLTQLLLTPLPFANDIALLAAAMWFASPLIVAHSMNGLETGLYYLALIVSLVYYFSIDATAPMRSGQRVALGLTLGVAFLARNDAVFFIAALLGTHVVLGSTSVGGGRGTRFGDAFVAGALSLLVASPWLAYNKLFFGSVVPISGTSQSHAAALGQNLRMIPANLIEAALLYVPIPRALETVWPVVGASMLILAALGWTVWGLFGRHSLKGQRFCLVALLFSAGIGGYYGFFFGAPHFVTRYISALSPLFAILSATAAYLLIARVLRDRRVFVAMGSAIVSVLCMEAVGLAVLDYARGESHMHKQVVQWVQENVDERQWVGAPQTGTLGYFHDRTLNLDGKVNPNALRAVIERTHVLTYVLDDTPINFIVDWVGMADWVLIAAEPRFGKAFEVVVKDEAANLAVLRRIVPIASP